MKLILASSSPRRRELLSKLNYEFEVVPADCDEMTFASAPCDMVKEIALHKALNVYKRYPDCCVIGCDTVVDVDGKVLGKPKDAFDAKNMLALLSDRKHKVHTGVCVMSKAAIYLFVETSEVTFDRLSAERISEYVATGSPMDKAGAYGIQDSGFVKQISGSYNNVMGLPTERIKDVLRCVMRNAQLRST